MELEKIKGRLERSLTLEMRAIAEDTFTCSVASEQPCERWFGSEVLSHDDGAVNLERLDGMVLLWNHGHDPQLGYKPLGKVINWEISDRRSQCQIKWSNADYVQPFRQNVADGILTNISIAYSIDSCKEVDETILVDGWTPYEVSLVSMPADHTVGIGRSDEQEILSEKEFLAQIDALSEKLIRAIAVEVEVETEDEDEMGESEDMGEGETMGDTEGEDTEAEDRGKGKDKPLYKSKMGDDTTGGLRAMEVTEIQNIREEESTRIRAIAALCNSNGLPDMAETFIHQGTTLENARAIVEKATRGQQNPLGGSQPADFVSGLEGKELANFSLVRLMRSMLPEFPEYQNGCLERAVSRTICNQLNGDPERAYIPTRQLEIQRRDTLSTQGQPSIIATELRPDMWIEALRNACLTLGLGARFITGLKGTLTFPKETGVMTAGWINEGGDAPESDYATTLVEMSPKTVASYTVITRRLLMQSTPDAEMIARNNLLQSIAQLIDQTALYGSGIGPTPLGVANTAGIKLLLPSGFGADGGYPTYAGLVTLMGEIDATNINTANLKWLINSKTRARLMITPMQSSGVEGNFIIGNDSANLIGYPFFVSNQVRSDLTKGNGTALSEAFLADWSKLYVGEWSGLSLSANTQGRTFRNNGVEYVAFQDLDMVVAQAEAFGYLSDIKTA